MTVKTALVLILGFIIKTCTVLALLGTRKNEINTKKVKTLN